MTIENEVSHTAADPKFPRDEKGRAVSRECEVCGYGKLQYQGDGEWICDGLADPEDEEKPLIACPHYHIDGEPVVTHKQPRAKSPSGKVRG